MRLRVDTSLFAYEVLTELLVFAVYHRKHLLAWSLALLQLGAFARCDKQQSLSRQQDTQGEQSASLPSLLSKKMLWITGQRTLCFVCCFSMHAAHASV